MDASFKPYLIRAVYEWCADKGFAPYLAVAVDASCKVPLAHVRNGQIVLDISMQATHQLQLGADAVSFQARFGGVAQNLYVPIERVLGVFPEHDHSLGAFFEVTDTVQTTEQTTEQTPQKMHEQAPEVGHEVPPVGKTRITRVK